MIKLVRSIVVLLVSLGMFSCKTEMRKSGVQESGILAIPDSLPWSLRMAETTLREFPQLWRMEETKSPRWSYTQGLVAQAFLQLWEKTGDQTFFDYAKAYADAMINSDGSINDYKKQDFNLDNLNPGKILFTLYDQTHEKKYLMALDTLRDQIKCQPRTNQGGFWHKKIYPHQMWLDGLYMGGPFYAQCGKVFHEPKDFDDVARWILLITRKTRDPKTGLLYHGWDESHQQKWSDPKTGLSQNFWGRGMGWYGMALVDVLDFLPEDHPKRDSIIDCVKLMAEAIVRVQDDSTGIWYQVLDKGHKKGNYLEGSVSCMFTYFLLKSIDKGYIDSDKYRPVAEKAYQGIIAHLITVKKDGEVVLSPVCAVSGLGGHPYRNGSYEYYINELRRDNDPKAVGPFIMASLLYENLQERKE